MTSFVLAASTSDYLMGAGALLIMSLVLMNTWKRSKAASQRKGPDPREQLERSKQTRAMKDDLQTMMVELSDLTRQFSSQLDARAVRMEKLIAEADQRIAELQRLQGGGPGAGQAASGNGTTAEAGAASSAAGADDLDPLTKRVYELADDGRDASTIAQQLDEHVGKVELILALRRAV